MRRKYLKGLLILLILSVGVLVGVIVVNRDALYFLFADATGKNASLVIEASGRYGVGPYVWKNLAQGGEERNPNTLTPVKEQVKTLDPQYIRIDHIYDFYDVVNLQPGNKLAYDWSKLDIVVNDILETGAKPLFALSYMPHVISSGNEVSTPLDWSMWQRVVKDTVSHFSGRNGKAIENVYYEVWNEPDLFGDFEIHGNKNYLTMYHNAAKGAAAATNILPFKIGGPATTNYYPNWMEALLEQVKNNSLRLDFISWHQYDPDINVFETNIKQAREVIKKYPEFENTEVLITEWGHDSNVEKGYDGFFGAIHTIAGATLMESMTESTLLTPQINKAFIFEIKDGLGLQKYWNRWGLYTHENFGIPEEKQRAKAVKFLNIMEGETIKVLGQGTWVKAFGKADGDVIRVLVTNYDPAWGHSEEVPMRFINLPFKEFTLRKRDFLGKIQETPITIEANVWETTHFAAPNSSTIFELIPKDEE